MNAEQAGRLYLRLNGFLMIPNFIVHPDYRGPQRTEVDLIGARFPYRKERVGGEVVRDHPRITELQPEARPCLVLTEVKGGRCDLNDSWRDQEKNLERMVQAVGMAPPAAKSSFENLYEDGVWTGDCGKITLLVMGDDRSDSLEEDYPRVPQITWEEAFEFIYDRFQKHGEFKADAEQWEEPYKKARDAASAPSQEAFVEEIKEW